MPKPVDPKEEARQDLAALSPLEETAVEPGQPLITGALVVYLGAARGHSQCLPGTLLETRIELPDIDEKTGQRKVDVLKQVSSEGHTTHDFATHDNFGRLIASHLLDGRFGKELEGKRWQKVEHPAHLHAFFRLKGPDGRTPLFRVLVPPDKKGALEEYISHVERRAGATEALFRATGGTVRGAVEAS